MRTSIRLLSAALIAGLAVIGGFAATATQSQAAEVKYIVNKEPITSYDIQRRTAMLKLMQRRGNLRQIAADEMIEQVLRDQEARRVIAEELGHSRIDIAEAYLG